MSDKPITLEQGIQILSRAFSSMRNSPPPPNPPGWEDKLGNGGASGETVRIPRPRHGFGGEDDPSVEAPGAQQMPGIPGAQYEGYPPGWTPRPYANGDLASTKYGPHNTVLSDQEAATLHLVWSILGIDGSTVGKGSVVPWNPGNLADRNYHTTRYDDTGGGVVSQAELNAQDDPARVYGYVDTAHPKQSAADSVARADANFNRNDAQYQARVADTAAQPNDGSHRKNMR